MNYEDNRTLGEKWHEQVEREGYLKPFLAFSLVLGVMFGMICWFGCEYAYGDVNKEIISELSSGEITNNESISATPNLEKAKAASLLKKIQAQGKRLMKAVEVSEKASTIFDTTKAFKQLEKAKKIKVKIAGYLKSLKKLKTQKTRITKAKKLWKDYTKAVKKASKAYLKAKKTIRDRKRYSKNAADLKWRGVMKSDGWRYTWYSQRVLPGGGLNIPGRHVGLAGMVMDGSSRVCVASSDLPWGTTLMTPFGKARVYDCGCPRGTIDIYTDW